MFKSLPAETVFEARKKTRKRSILLMGLLIAVYVVFFNVVSLCVLYVLLNPHFLAGVFVPLPFFERMMKGNWTIFYLVSSCLAVLIALIHILNAKNKPLDKILSQIGSIPADPNDRYHSVFIHIVSEVESAIGKFGITPVVLPSSGFNAFSIEDGQGKQAIGVTEGLLSELNRNQLGGVIAHEAAHLANGDSQMMTTASSLSGVFHELMGFFRGGTSKAASEKMNSKGGAFLFSFAIFYLISSIADGLTLFISMAVSREREYLADALAVHMCEDPLSLAESLYKISRSYRGGLQIPGYFNFLFMVNPSHADSGLLDKVSSFLSIFSTHPPIAKRLDKLMSWAKSDLAHLKEKAEKPSLMDGNQKIPDKTEAQTEPGFFAKFNEEWKGPFKTSQILAMREITPYTWVSWEDKTHLCQAGDDPMLLPIFGMRMNGKVSKNACPRCKVFLVDAEYEGAPVLQCSFCHGILLKRGELERVLARHEKEFSKQDRDDAELWKKTSTNEDLSSGHFPSLACPLCKGILRLCYHSIFTHVLLDKCVNPDCGAIWTDGGALDRIKILLKEAL